MCLILSFFVCNYVFFVVSLLYMNLKKLNLPLIGFLQASGVISYCFFMGVFMWFANRLMGEPPEFWGVTLMMILLVFSAAITGVLVFGYPVYLVINRRIKESLLVFAYTLLYLLIMIIFLTALWAMWRGLKAL